VKSNYGKKAEKLRYNMFGVEHETAWISSGNVDFETINKRNQESKSFLSEVHQKFVDNYGIGCVVAFKNGNAFTDGGINVVDSEDKRHNYMTYPVYMSDDKVYDERHGYNGTDVYEYIDMLARNNPLLRYDPTLTYGTLWNEKIAIQLDKYSKRR
jgi:hypothetical protein